MKLRDGLELLLLGGIWGASFLFMRIAAPVFKPIPLIELRVVSGGLLLLALLAWTGRLHKLGVKPQWVALVGITNSAVPFSLFAYATLSLPAGYAAVLNATAPLFSAIIGFVWLRESMTLGKLMGLLIGFAGVIVLVSGKLTQTTEQLAVLAGLGAAFLYGVAAHVTKRHLSQQEPLVVASGSQIAASLFLLPGVIVNPPESVPSTSSWLAVLVLGIVCTGVAYALYFGLLHRVGPTHAMTVAYLIPLFGVLWGYLFLSEPITPVMVIGGVLVLSGVYMLVRPARVPAAIVQKTA